MSVKATSSERVAAATGEVGVVRQRLDGDEAVLRLQLRRLFRALAVVRQTRSETAEDLPRQLVSQG